VRKSFTKALLGGLRGNCRSLLINYHHKKVRKWTRNWNHVKNWCNQPTL